MEHVAGVVRGARGDRLERAVAWTRGVAVVERQRLVLFLPVAMGAGSAWYFGLRSEPPLWPVLAAATGFALLAMLARRSVAGRAAALAGVAFSLGVLTPMWQTRRVLPMVALPRHAVVVEGTVRVVDPLPDGGVRLTIGRVSLDGAPPVARTLRIRLRDDDPASVSDGDRLQIRALVRSPSGPAYPGAWDLQRDAFFSGLAGSGFALGDARLAGRAKADGTAAWWQGVRDAIAWRFETGLPGPRGAIAATLMVGRSTSIAAGDRAAFTNSGLAHLLAVAGLHIGIVMGLALGLARSGLACWPYAALRWPTRQIASVFALAAGGIYLLLTGAHLPIVRSFCMAALATFGIALGRRAVSMRGLGVAAATVLLVWPNEITGVSFQMSFSAVAALIAGYEALRPVFSRAGHGGSGRRLGTHVLALALTSALAGTASAPFAAYHFGQIQLYFVLANMVAVPITAMWVMPLGLMSLLLMPLGAAPLATIPMGWGIGAILWIARTVSGLPSATMSVPHMPLDGLLVLSAGIAVLCLLRSRLRLVGAALILAGLLSPSLVTPPDVLVSDDAKLIGMRAGTTLLLAKRTGASKFTLEAFERYWATSGDPVLLPAGSACAADRCRFVRHGATVLVPLASSAPMDCAGTGLVVASFPLRAACPGVTRVDRFSVWRDGSAAVWLGPAPRIVTDRSWRGDRPWVPAVPVARGAARTSLPKALAE